MKFEKGECERVRKIMGKLDRKTVKEITEKIINQEQEAAAV